jgi:hypothetical protein
MDFIATNCFTDRLQKLTFATKKFMDILLNVLQCQPNISPDNTHVVLTPTVSITKNGLKLRRCDVYFDLT